MGIAIDDSFWEVGWTTYYIKLGDNQQDRQKKFFKTEEEARAFEQKIIAALTILGYTSPQAHLYCCEYKFG